jgi:hypothetical protein
MDEEMLKRAAYGTVAGYIASALIAKNEDAIVDKTVELSKAIVDKLYA